MAGITEQGREAGEQITDNTKRLLRDMCRTYGLPDPAPLTYREEAALARIQAETGLRALDMGNYSAALAYFRDAADFMEKAVRKIGGITK